MNIVTIHGAFSSKNAFNYIISKFPEHEWTEFDYSYKINGIDDIIEEVDLLIQKPSVSFPTIVYFAMLFILS